MTQMWTNVQQTTEVVALKPTALTLWGASLVPVNQDTPGTDLPAQIIIYLFIKTVTMNSE